MSPVLSRYARRHRPDDLVVRWRLAATAEGYSMVDWDHPANEALVETVLDRRDPTAVLERVIAARYEAGFTFAECLGDMRALVERLPWPQARQLSLFDVAVIVGAVFVERVEDDLAFSLSGLPDRRYLAARTRETYRPIHRTLRWVYGVVRIEAPGAGWAGVSRQLRVAAVVEAAFWSAHCLAGVSSDCYVALQPDRADTATACLKVTSALAEERISARCWIEPLPPYPVQVPALIEAISNRSCAPPGPKTGWYGNPKW